MNKAVELIAMCLCITLTWAAVIYGIVSADLNAGMTTLAVVVGVIGTLADVAIFFEEF